MEKTAISQAGQMAENLMALTLLQHMIEAMDHLTEPELKEALRLISTLPLVGEA